MIIAGLGPHGESAAPFEAVALSNDDVVAARNKRFNVALVLHTTASDWSEQLIAGVTATFDECAATLTVFECGFSAEVQKDVLDRLAREKLDAIISIPVANAKVADAHRRVSRAGIRLMLLDNVPTGLLPGSDYVALVSADNFALGTIAASFLAERIAESGTVGILSFDSEFIATNEREIAFDKWMRLHRPDIQLISRKFDKIECAGEEALALIASQPDLAGLFVVWDSPAMEVINALKRSGLHLPLSTIDLGRDVAIELASGGMVCGIGAQQPSLQGRAAAQACVLSLLGKETPVWIALPGLCVSAENAWESFQRLSESTFY